MTPETSSSTSMGEDGRVAHNARRSVEVDREALEAIRDGYLVTKTLLRCTPEEIAAADHAAILSVVNGGYDVLKNLLWQVGATDA